MDSLGSSVLSGPSSLAPLSPTGVLVASRECSSEPWRRRNLRPLLVGPPLRTLRLRSPLREDALLRQPGRLSDPSPALPLGRISLSGRMSSFDEGSGDETGALVPSGGSGRRQQLVRLRWLEWALAVRENPPSHRVCARATGRRGNRVARARHQGRQLARRRDAGAARLAAAAARPGASHEAGAREGCQASARP